MARETYNSVACWPPSRLLLLRSRTQIPKAVETFMPRDSVRVQTYLLARVKVNGKEGVPQVPCFERTVWGSPAQLNLSLLHCTPSHLTLLATVGLGRCSIYHPLSPTLLSRHAQILCRQHGSIVFQHFRPCCVLFSTFPSTFRVSEVVYTRRRRHTDRFELTCLNPSGIPVPSLPVGLFNVGTGTWEPPRVAAGSDRGSLGTWMMGESSSITCAKHLGPSRPVDFDQTGSSKPSHCPLCPAAAPESQLLLLPPCRVNVDETRTVHGDHVSSGQPASCSGTSGRHGEPFGRFSRMRAPHPPQHYSGLSHRRMELHPQPRATVLARRLPPAL